MTMSNIPARTYFGEYLIFKGKVIEGRKTPVYFIYSKQDLDFELGKILFYPAWRKFVFEPANETLFDTKCLADIQEMLGIATSEWRNSLKE